MMMVQKVPASIVPSGRRGEGSNGGTNSTRTRSRSRTRTDRATWIAEMKDSLAATFVVTAVNFRRSQVYTMYNNLRLAWLLW